MKPLLIGARLAAATLAALVPASLAQAQDCAEAMTQSDINACIYADWEAADAELNAAWKAAMALMRSIDDDLPEEEKGAAAQLGSGQKAWIAFRDATCAAEGYLMHGGSAEPMLIYGCMARLTADRTKDLRALTQIDG